MLRRGSASGGQLEGFQEGLELRRVWDRMETEAREAGGGYRGGFYVMDAGCGRMISLRSY